MSKMSIFPPSPSSSSSMATINWLNQTICSETKCCVAQRLSCGLYVLVCK